MIDYFWGTQKLIMRLLTVILLLFIFSCKGNQHKASAEEGRIDSLSRFAEQYYLIRDFVKGDSITRKAKRIAEEKSDKDLVLKAVFGNLRHHSSTLLSLENYQLNETYLQEALQTAAQYKDDKHIVLAKEQLSIFYRTGRKLNDALTEALQGFDIARQLKDDSLQAIMQMEIGKIYEDKSQTNNAYKAYSAALDLSKDNDANKSKVYNRIGYLYYLSGDLENANKFTRIAIDLDKPANNYENLVLNYMNLAKYAKADEKDMQSENLKTALDWANKSGDRFLQNKVQRNIFIRHQANGEAEQALQLLRSNTYLQQFYVNSGPGYMDWLIAETYWFASKSDSAIWYFEKAKPLFDSAYDAGTRRDFMIEMADAYAAAGKWSQAETNYQHLLNSEMEDIASETLAFKSSMSRFYANQGKYQEAYYNLLASKQMEDSISKKNSAAELAKNEIENAQKEADWAHEKQKQEEDKKHTMNYYLISLLIFTSFVLMLVTGLFSISNKMVRVMGIISFLCLFEFIILLIDHWLIEVTHNNPLYIWLIKIAIMAVLAPLHHFLEHKIVHFVSSEKFKSLRAKAVLAKKL